MNMDLIIYFCFVLYHMVHEKKNRSQKTIAYINIKEICVFMCSKLLLQVNINVFISLVLLSFISHYFLFRFLLAFHFLLNPFVEEKATHPIEYEIYKVTCLYWPINTRERCRSYSSWFLGKFRYSSVSSAARLT